ncbi:MAG: HAD family phosphatase [Sphaerochaetaceae bacterium]|nr:HAD family phosphatase [Sphaerochaetaceae bacterium]
MDGIIFDSEKAVIDQWIIVADKYGIPNIKDTFIKCIGTSYKDTQKVFEQTYGPGFDYMKYRNEMSKLYHEKYDNGLLPLKKGAVEILQTFKKEGVRLALASSSNINTVKSELKGAGLLDYFEVVLGGNMVTQGKPHPEIFLKTATELKVKPEETYVIEDSFNGIRAAYNGGFIPIMVPDILLPNEEMREKSKLIFNDLVEVKNYFLNNFIFH